MTQSNQQISWKWNVRRAATSAMFIVAFAALSFFLASFFSDNVTAQDPPVDAKAEYATDVQPLIKKYCSACHSTAAKKGSLDLEWFVSLERVRREIKPWQQLREMVEANEMPPHENPQPTAKERQRLLTWTKQLLRDEATARAGDPGVVPLRRLSNAEYDYTIRDLTGVDLRPTREFPADGAAGEGFANAAEALSDISPALLEKYLAAAKDSADRAVLLSDGFRFSSGKTRRDWTDESTARLRAFYAPYAASEGRLSIQPYLAATVKHREKLLDGKVSPQEIAIREKLSGKYLTILWQILTDKTPSNTLDTIRRHWRDATEKDVPTIVAEIAAQQKRLWLTVKVGSYVHSKDKTYFESTSRQVEIEPATVETAGDDRNESAQQIHADNAAFRRVFPLFLCFPEVIPTDEVVSLKMFHQEDEPLVRLFLDGEQTARLQKLWAEHRFISRQAVAENDYLPLFIGFVTQDQPKEMVAYFNSQRPVFQKRADDFVKDEEAAVPRQLAAIQEFAAKAYRRPLAENEKTDLDTLYETIRERGTGHDEAFRGVLARVLVSPTFLFRIEHAPAGKNPASVDDWELATRLSYFLWSSTPDDELRKLAAAGQLRDPKVLANQVERMLKDERVRALAIEFGTQSIHVRGFDEFKEKNEKMFPTFDSTLRTAIYEESILFFQDLFQHDRAVKQILDSDHTFLNETLAKHYGIPGVTGTQWRQVDGVRKYGRGGVLGLASVQAKQAGASRTSPVLRGNWVVETLLGEKLPRPPADVPKLPEVEGEYNLSMRQQVEQHTKLASCAVCHVRIDPFGFALENYDAIGRLRTKDLSGSAIDAKAKLRDGTEFDGIDGLRTYLLTKKKEVIVRLFCRRLLGYALGRAVVLSDEILLDEMADELDKNDGKISVAVQSIVRSPQSAV